MKFILAISFFLLSAVCAEKVRYDSYRVYRVIPNTEAQVLKLGELQKSIEYDFWIEPSTVNAPVSIMVSPQKAAELENFLTENHLEHSIKIENVQSLIDEEAATLSTRSNTMEWTNYHSLEEIYAWMDDLINRFPNIVKPVVVGKTYEGRDIRGLEIIFEPNRTGVYIESGMHAREWTTIYTTTFMINEILTGNVDPIFKQFNYLYVPVFNPDGFIYSWTKDRMWSKTRTPYNTTDKVCYGADPNRNYDIHFNIFPASYDPCHEYYAGPQPFSEVETRTTAEFMDSVWKKYNLDIFLTYHCPKMHILFPWGWTSHASEHHNIFNVIAESVTDAIYDVHGVEFRYMTLGNDLYKVGGTNIDYYYGKYRPNVVFFFLLRDKYGFIVPPNEIIPSGEEQLAGLKQLLLDYDLFILN